LDQPLGPEVGPEVVGTSDWWQRDQLWGRVGTYLWGAALGDPIGSLLDQPNGTGCGEQTLGSLLEQLLLVNQQWGGWVGVAPEQGKGLVISRVCQLLHD
jgi:hypothetical protein